MRGVVLSAGGGQHGSLGQGDAVTQLSVLTPIRALEAYRVVAVSAGGHHSLVLTEEGRVFSFGNGLHGRLGHGNEETCFEPRRIAFFDTTAGVAKISAGTTHSLALTKDGKAYSFGFGMFGRLGHGDETDQLLPREITLRGHGASPPVGDRVEENETDPVIEHVAAGYFHSLLLTTDGRVYSFGAGVMGALGHGDRDKRLRPTMIEALADRRIVSMACGSANTLVLDDEGRVFFFGLDYSEFPKFTEGQARFVLLPSALGLAEEITEVRAGEGHCLLLTREGKLLAFGLGKNGRLGLGDETNRLAPTAVTFPSNGTVRDIACGAKHGLALVDVPGEGPRLYAFGSGDQGQLANGHRQDRASPTATTTSLPALLHQHIVPAAISAGKAHSLVLL